MTTEEAKAWVKSAAQLIIFDRCCSEWESAKVDREAEEVCAVIDANDPRHPL